MVCKEDVLLWFKDLDGHKRIDVLYELLNMCLPFELRFIGSCMEELGKHTYQELRGPSITANDLEKLSKDVSLNQGILDESVRHRLLIYLSLLSSRNHSVASWLYRKFFRTECMEEYLVKDKGKDETLHSEFLLLFTMALHHPAFNFEHKQFFSRILVSLIDIRENRISAKHKALGYPPGFGYPTQMPLENPPVPVKTAPTPSGDSPSVFHQPPGLLHLQPPIDYITAIWNRPGFPYVFPEVPPFPARAISPLVSQTASPSQSRSSSPHRTAIGRPSTSTTMLPPQTNVPPTVVPLPIAGMPMKCAPPPAAGEGPPGGSVGPPAIKLPPEQLSEKRRAEDDVMKPEIKPNGLIRPFLVDQMQAMNLDAENSLHQSNSSSNSSPNETPPGTPRTNGHPPFAPPAPDYPFAGLPPHRSLFRYNRSFRPPFAAPFPAYALPYVHFMYSSPFRHRSPIGCCNCGAADHAGGECRGQSVDDITEKKSYRLEFQATLPDAEK